MTRVGKIACLPWAIREELNRRLYDGVKGKTILQWLNALPEVAAIMNADFDRQPVNHVNLSQWKKGGYRDWLAEQSAVRAIESLMHRSDAYKKHIANGLTECMTDFLTARMAEELLRLKTKSNATAKKGAEAAQSDNLGEWINRLARMRRAEFRGRSLDLERQRLELLREKNRKDFEEEFWKWAGQEHIRAQVCKGRSYTEAEKRRLTRHILGLPPLDEDRPRECGPQMGKFVPFRPEPKTDLPPPAPANPDPETEGQPIPNQGPPPLDTT